MVLVYECIILRLTVGNKDRLSIFAVMDVSATLQKLNTDLTSDERSTIKRELSAYLNHLLINDFEALVQILYRVDVSEQKLKTVLRENKEADAGDLMAELILQRQMEKRGMRDSFPSVDDVPGNEGW